MQYPLNRNYKAGSIIYFEGDQGHEIFVLKKGRIKLAFTKYLQKGAKTETLKIGEFFGVKSVIGGFPREETVQVVEDSMVIVFNQSAFQKICFSNINLVFKMLRIYSGQLREVHKAVRELLGESNIHEAYIEMLRVGESYYQQGKTELSKYVFQQYLKYYPSSRYVDRVFQLVEMLDKNLSYPVELESLEELLGGVVQKPNDVNNNNLSEAENIDSNLSEAPSIAFQEEEEGQLQKDYYTAINFISQDDLPKAIEVFENIINLEDQISQKDQEWYHKAHFELGRAYHKQNLYDKSIQTLSSYIQYQPSTHEAKKSLFIIANILEHQNKKDKAIQTYNQVVNFPPFDKDSKTAKEHIEKLKG